MASGERQQIKPYSTALKQRARSLRKQATFPERLLWSRLRRKRLGVRFSRQRPVEDFVLDFYCPEYQLAIEIDGRSHEGHFMYDRARQQQLEIQGIQLLRFTNDEVLSDVEAVVLRIAAWLEEAASNPSLEGGGPGRSRGRRV